MNNTEQGPNLANEKQVQKTWGHRLKSSLLISLVFVGVWLVIALAAGGRSRFGVAIGIDTNGIEQHFVMLYDHEQRIGQALNVNRGEVFDPSDGDIVIITSDGLREITVTSDGRSHKFDFDWRTLGQHVWHDMILDPLGFDGHYGSGYGFFRSLDMNSATAARMTRLTGNAFWVFVGLSVFIFIVRK